MDKKQLRQEGKQLLESWSESKRFNIAKETADQLFQTEWWKSASTIGITLAQAHEIPTNIIIEKAWGLGKSVCVPKCKGKTREMIFYKITLMSQLEKAYFGLLEPKIEETTMMSQEKIDLMFVPGLLFDQTGYRIGYGGGFYDRYLASFSQTTISLISEEQIIDKVPTDQYDIPVNHIITENGILF